MSDRDKVLKQGVPLDVYQTLQCFMGGILSNYFNRFGRQWQIYVQAEGDYHTVPTKWGNFLCATPTATWCQCGPQQSVHPTAWPEFTMRYNLLAAAPINASAEAGPAGLGPGHEGDGGGFCSEHAARDGLGLPVG